MRSHLWMGIGLGAGLLLGLAAAGLADAGYPQMVRAAQWIRPIGTLFLNLLSMVVIPLVATALFAGIARLGNLRRVSRLVVRTLAFFWGTALVAIVIGFIVGAIVLPHAVVSPEQQAALRAAAVADSGFIRKAAEDIPSGARFIIELIPANPVKAAVDGNLHIARSIAGFSLPLGASVNRAGSALYQAIAVLFIARLYGIPFGFTEMFTAAAAVFLASLTVASVPAASVVSLLPAFTATGLPISGLSILIGLDRIPDMFRTMTNVTGHLTGAVVVPALEGAPQE